MVIYSSFQSFACLLNTCILRRHLMVWKIFAPRLLFSLVSLFVTIAAVCFSRLLVVRCLISSLVALRFQFRPTSPA
ncbi:unnamed protein product [Protopolystoma xenopodis]|uniref:Uncharacterized protein n=1 Tax=Protopolystoma xenopodis TaxID=117903 RepID=A0A3S5C0Y6_9PLAT|nr:unnamed protein product [Protopolystoma xenopodis]